MFDNNTNLVAILGPTNTGKTYLAFEKLFLIILVYLDFH